MNSTSKKWNQKTWSERSRVEKGISVALLGVPVGMFALIILHQTGVVGDKVESSNSSSSALEDSTEPTTVVPVEPTFSQAEIASQSAESAYIVSLSRAGINYDRSTLIELGKTACESLTIATDQGLSKSAAKLGLAQQYASGGSITQKEAIAIVSAAATTFCPEHKGGY